MKVSLSIEKYHEDKSAVSSSAFRHLDKCPAYYQEYKKGNFNKDASYFRIGSAFHIKVLEPELFDESFILIPKIDGRTKEGKEKKAEFEEIKGTRTILNSEEFNQVSKMYDSVLKHPIAWELLTAGGEAEPSFFWFEPVEDAEIITCPFCEQTIIEEDTFGEVVCVCGQTVEPGAVWCKTRPDYIAENFIVDLKSTKNLEGFANSVTNMYYNAQAALQIAGANAHGFEIENYYWVVTEKTYPYLTAVYKASEQTLADGRDRLDRILKVYKKALDSNDWYGYPNLLEI